MKNSYQLKLKHMKRIYLMLLIFATCLFANATERLWNFTNGKGMPVNVNYYSSQLPAPEFYTTVLTVPADYTSWISTLCTSSCSQGLELCKNYKIAGVSKVNPTFGTFSGDFQLDGLTPAVTPPAIPTTSYLSFNVDGNVDITLYCNPKDAVAKILNVVNSSGVVVQTITTSAVSSPLNTNAEVITVTYTGPATKLTIYPTYSYNYNISCLFIYAIAVKDNPPTIINENVAAVAIKKVGNQIQNDKAASVEIYTVLGAKVLVSSETSIDISGLASGVYIARTSSGSLKFIK